MRRAARYLLVLVCCLASQLHAQTSWKGTSSTSWNNAANWTAGVPTSSTDAIIGDANFTGANQPTVNVASSCKSLTLGAGTKASTLTVSKALTVSGNVTIGSNGTLSHATTSALSLAGNWTNNGAYSPSANNRTITFSGAAQTFAGTSASTYRRITINSSSTVTLAASVAANNTVTINGILDPGTGSGFVLSGTGAFTVGAAGKILVRATTFAGNYTISGTKTLSAGSTVEYAASGSQTVDNSLTYSTLRISGSGTKSLTANLPALNSSSASAGNIYVVAGTFDLAGFTANRGTSVAGGTISVANGATLKVGGTSPFPANFATRSLEAFSTVEFSGTNQTISAETYGHLILSSTGTATKTMPASAFTVSGNFSSVTNAGGASVSFTAGAAITFNGHVTLGAGTTFNAASFAHSVGGNWTNHGTFTGATSTVTINAPNGILAGAGATTFNNLTLARSGITMSSNTSATVSGNLATTGVGSFTHNTGGSGTITMSGASKTISGSGLNFNNLTISGSVSAADSFTVSGNLAASGSFTASAGTLTLAGSSKTVSGTGTLALNALNVPGTITTTNNFSLAGALSVSGSFAATAGTVTFNGTTLVSGTASIFNSTLDGTLLRMTPGSMLRLGGTTTLVAGTFDPTTLTPNTIVYNGASAQSVFPITYYNLEIATGGDKSAIGNITTVGDLTINAGAVFRAGSGGYTNFVQGNWRNSGTFDAGNGTVEFSGATDADIAGGSTFNRLRVNKSAASMKVLLATNQTVATLDMISGWMDTGTNAVTITTTRNGGGVILGTITRTHSFTTGTAYAFESPDNTISFASLGTVSSVTMNVAAAPVGDFPFGASINREYNASLTASGGYSATLRLHYEDAELNGNTESTLNLWRHSGGWSLSGRTTGNATSNWVEQTGLADLTGRWTLAGAANNVVRWNGSVSTAWENAANWTALQGAPSLPPGTNDIVALGDVTFANQPTITSAASVKSISFGSAQAVTLTLGGGGSLATLGNVEGDWTNNATHTIAVAAQTLAVGGNLSLSDGTNNHAIAITASTGTVSVGSALSDGGVAQSAITFNGSGALNIAGNFMWSSGAFTPGSSTVTFNGSGAQNVPGVSYHHLLVNKSSGTATLGATTTAGGDLLLAAGTLTLEAALTVTGNVSVAAGTTLHGGDGSLTISGNWTNSGTFVPGTGTVVFTGGNAQNIGASTFNNFTVNKTPGTAALVGSLAINGDMTLASGTLDMGTNTANRSSLGGTLTLSANTTLKVGASFPANFSTRSLAASSTVIYNGAAAQSVSGETYGHLVLTNGGSNAKTLAAAAVAAGDLTIHSNATFAASSYLLELGGNWTNRGAFNAGTGTLKPVGAGKFISGDNELNNFNVTGSYTVDGSPLNIHGNLTVLGSLDCGSGAVTLDGDLLNSGSLTSGGTTTFTGTRVQTMQLLGALLSSSSGVINFNGSVAPVLYSTTAPAFVTVNINNTAGITPSVGWTAYGPFTVASNSAFYAGSSAHNFYHAFLNNGTVTSSGTLNFQPAANTVVRLGGVSFASTGTVRFGGTNAITLLGNGSAFQNLVVANTHANGITASTNWTIGGSLAISSGATLRAGAGLSHSIAGDMTTDGTFNGQTSTVTLNGTTTLSGNGEPDFYNLAITGTTTMSADCDVLGNFTNNGAFDATGFVLTFEGSSPSVIAGTNAATIDTLTIAKTAATVTLATNLTGLTTLTLSSGTLDTGIYSVAQDAGGGSLTISSGATLKLGGTNSFPAFNTLSLDAASTVEYAGSSAQTVAAQNYGHLTSSSTGTRTLASSGTIGVAGTFTPGANTFTITGSTMDFNGAGAQTIPAFNYQNLTSSSTGARTLSGTVGVAGTFTPGANSYTVTGSTMNFNGAAQTVPAFTYGNLTTSGSGAKTLGGNATAGGNVNFSAGSFADGGFTLTANGDVASTITHSGAGKILLSGGSTNHVLSGGGAFQNLELNDTNGAALSATNLNVNGTLTLTTGVIATSTNKVVAATGASVSRTNGWVNGSLQKNVATGATTSAFEIGDATNYAPVSVVFGNVTVAGNLAASTTTGDHSDITNSGIAAARSVNRYWTVTNSGIAFNNYSATFQFTTNDVDSIADTTKFIVAKRDSGSWTLPTVGTKTSTNTQATGMTSFSDFQVGQSSSVPAITNQPVSQRVNIGSNVTFTVAASGATPLSYQWRKDGAGISGATSASYSITGVGDLDAASYSCVVTNVNGSDTSSNAVLTINHAPSLSAITTQTINELGAWSYTNSASDADGGTITWSLTAAPGGASIDSSGVISWTPSEAQGPSTNTFTVQVSDDGSPALTDSKTFSVVVNEVNSAPTLTVPADQTLNELATLTVTNTATDGDVPANVLTFSLVSPPSGMSIDSSSGVITWTPSEAQGPSTNTVTVRATDNGPPNLTDTKSFTVIVNEVNTAPTLTVPGTQMINELAALTVTNAASDADVPANTLTFSLVDAPEGASIDASTGVIT